LPDKIYLLLFIHSTMLGLRDGFELMVPNTI